MSDNKKPVNTCEVHAPRASIECGDCQRWLVERELKYVERSRDMLMGQMMGYELFGLKKVDGKRAAVFYKGHNDADSVARELSDILVRGDKDELRFAANQIVGYVGDDDV